MIRPIGFPRGHGPDFRRGAVFEQDTDPFGRPLDGTGGEQLPPSPGGGPALLDHDPKELRLPVAGGPYLDGRPGEAANHQAATLYDTWSIGAGLHKDHVAELARAA